MRSRRATSHNKKADNPIAIKAPKWHYTDAVKFLKDTDVTETRPSGIQSTLPMRAGSGFERCEYRTEDDGTISVKITFNNVLIRNIPHSNVCIALPLNARDPSEDDGE